MNDNDTTRWFIQFNQINNFTESLQMHGVWKESHQMSSTYPPLHWIDLELHDWSLLNSSQSSNIVTTLPRWESNSGPPRTKRDCKPLHQRVTCWCEGHTLLISRTITLFPPLTRLALESTRVVQFNHMYWVHQSLHIGRYCNNSPKVGIELRPSAY